MIGGGLDRKDLQNYDPDAMNESDDPHRSMGCHVGLYAGLNVDNPQPGCHYSWADSSPRGLREARLLRKHVVTIDDPEMAAYRNNPEDTTTSGAIDSSNSGYPGVVLVKRSAEDERMIRDEEARQRASLLRSGDTERAYQNGATASEIQHGGTRFQREDHRTYATDGPSADGRMVDSWTPDRGISS